MIKTKIIPLNHLITLGFTALLVFPVIVEAKSAPREWYCKVSAFTDSYDAIGRSRAEAKLAARQKCTAEHNRMHCEDIKCEGPSEEMTDIDSDDEDSTSNHGWICKLTPFTDRYMASANTRAKAKIKVIKMCEQKHNKMFCEDPECEEG